MDENSRMNRRRFFRHGLGELLKPLARSVEPLARAAEQLGAMEQMLGGTATPARKEPSPPPRTYPNPYAEPGPWLRPPGARPEQEFLSACSRCGECVRACPVECIRIDETGINGNGAPFINVEAMPSVLCEGLNCMHICPTGALVPTAKQDIDMGTAEWQELLCWRTHGQECTTCIDTCPVGTDALELLDGKVHVKDAGCTGCGVCQYRCPSNPKSILVKPKSARETNLG